MAALGAATPQQASCYERFTTVQTILDRNKLLINEINANHESKSAEGLQHNVVLIRELNQNIARIVHLYKELSASFAENSQGGLGVLQPS